LPTSEPSYGCQTFEKKNPGSSNLKKQAAPICEIREICERLKNMALGDIDFSRE